MTLSPKAHSLEIPLTSRIGTRVGYDMSWLNMRLPISQRKILLNTQALTFGDKRVKFRCGGPIHRWVPALSFSDVMDSPVRTNLAYWLEQRYLTPLWAWHSPALGWRT